MAQVLTVKRSDVSNLFVDPQTGVSAFPASFERENYQPFHIIGEMPKDFFKLETTMIEREVAEKDNVNLQVIPYVIMINQEENKIFIYQRGSGSAEDRLVSKYSIGLGGHIDISPDAWVNLPQVIAKEAIRELEEEVGYVASAEERNNILEGFQVASSIIFTEADEVGTVHLGVSLLMNIKPERLGKLENNVITSGRWLTFDEIAIAVQNKEIELENWSNLVLMHIQSINSQRNDVVGNMLNEQMAQVHNAFNRVYHLSKSFGIEEATTPGWEAFKTALATLNKELDEKVKQLIPEAASLPLAPADAANDSSEEPKKEEGLTAET